MPYPWRVAQAPRGGNWFIYDADNDRVPSQGTHAVLQRICDAVNGTAPTCDHLSLANDAIRLRLNGWACECGEGFPTRPFATTVCDGSCVGDLETGACTCREPAPKGDESIDPERHDFALHVLRQVEAHPGDDDVQIAERLGVPAFNVSQACARLRSLGLIHALKGDEGKKS